VRRSELTRRFQAESQRLRSFAPKKKTIHVVGTARKGFFSKSHTAAFDILLLPAGEHWMGSKDRNPEAREDEKPRHRICISRPFWMGKTQVNQALFFAVMGTNPSKFQGDDFPVEQVSWYDAVDFCNRLSELLSLSPVYEINGYDVRCDGKANGFRLPTEGEWEYAARAGTKYRFSGSNNLDEVSWNSENSGRRTQPVGTKKANGWGLHDMSGNVWEWCWDFYGDDTYATSAPGGVSRDPQGPQEGLYRVFRGGCWIISEAYSRVARRNLVHPVHMDRFLGFRIVRNGEKSSA
jgi:formylglycine-generating enzyme